jgi:hypothetical protein
MISKSDQKFYSQMHPATQSLILWLPVKEGHWEDTIELLVGDELSLTNGHYPT